MFDNLYLAKKRDGFTLIEIIIVISIIGILSLFLIIGFRGDEKQRALNNSALKAVDGIKRVQTMALAGSQVDGQMPASYNFLISDCGDGGCFYRLVGKMGDESVVEIEKVNLDEDVLVGTSGNVEIDFFPPRAKATVLIGGVEQNSALIEFSHLDSSITPKCVEMSPISGRVDIENCSIP